MLPPLVIRPIRPDDEAALRRGLERLSPESRHLRFTATLLGDDVASHRLFEAISERVSARDGGGLEELVAELEPLAA